MLQRVKAENLAVGMFVVEYGGASFKDSSTRVNIKLQSEAEVNALQSTGIIDFLVDTEKSPASLDTQIFQKSLTAVDTKLNQAVAHAHSMLEDTRLGKAFDPQGVLAVIDSMLETVFANRSAALFLTKLGNYDDYTYMHCVNVSVLASLFGKFLKLSDSELHSLSFSGFVHDLGKSLIPTEILNKPGKLTEKEFMIMKSHPIKGYMLLRHIPNISKDVVLGALQHHEKWNGEGYPRGLKGEKINLFARILAIVDIYDAMTSNRVYHKKRAETDVLGYLFQHKDDFAPSYVELFVKTVGIYPPGTFVRVSNGREAVVCSADPLQPTMPTIAFVSETTRQIEAKSFPLSSLSINKEPLKITEVLNHPPGTIDLAPLLLR